MVGKIKYCDECGKEFYADDVNAWIYKRFMDAKKGVVYYCGWNCFRKEEKRRGIDRNGRDLKKYHCTADPGTMCTFECQYCDHCERVSD